MTDSLTTEPEARDAVLVAPMEEGGQQLASDLEVAALQEQINVMNAKAQQIEHEIATMQAENGNAASASEIEHARSQARDMRSAAATASNALSNAPTDPKTGKKQISAKRVASLSLGISSFIGAGEREGAAIKEASAEAELHEVATHAKAANSVTAKVTGTIAKCARGVACAVGIKPATPKHGWMHDGMRAMEEGASEVEAFGASISAKAGRAWNGFTASVAAGFSAVTNYDYVGTAKRTFNGALNAASNATNAVVGAVTDTVSAGVQKARNAGSYVLNVASAAGEKLSQAKDAALGALSHLNPFSSAQAATPPHPAPHKAAPAHKPASPAHKPATPAHHDSAVHEVYEKGKALVASISNSLPHVSMPSFSSLWPSSTPPHQGVKAKSAHVN